MAKNLVIVESPAKVKTIKKFLGSNYEVDASGGHVRDLPKSTLGVDVEHGYEPKYITIRGKGDVLARLRKEVKKADKIYLATDPDREGEAISWHLMKALKLDEQKDKKVYRISFNEITKNAVKASLKEPRAIDENLVDAQQARRMLDRMVGYLISPLLWAKVKRGLSAGRVQSVALRMICDREEEINAFIPEEYWTLDAQLHVHGSRKKLTAHYYGDKDGRKAIHSKEEVEALMKRLEGCEYEVRDVKLGERVKKAPIPFTTSTLQQEASKTLNFSTQKTMRLAQQLYEGVDIKGRGTIGLITYLRTDSTRIAAEADAAARSYIGDQFGASYVSEAPAAAKSDAKIQDAHEAIRPTDITLTPVQVKEQLSRDQFRLYQLIWKRFTASRMRPAVYETTSVKVAAGEELFTLSASKIKFDGFMSVYSQDEDKETDGVLNESLEAGMKLDLNQLEPAQHFTQPPAHYTEASLVKALEEQGIGRPSTYAPTITTIIARRYVAKENKNLYVTELGGMELQFPSPLLYYDLQKIYALIHGTKQKESLDTVVEELHLTEDRPFHRALDDAYYTGRVMSEMDFYSMMEYVSVDYYQPPLTEEEEIYLEFPEYAKFVSREHETKEEILEERRVAEMVCYKCRRTLRKKIRWFSSNQKFYFCLAVCPEHGYMKGKIRMKKSEDGSFFAVKTTKLVGEEGAAYVEQKKEETKKKRAERNKAKKSGKAAEAAE